MKNKNAYKIKKNSKIAKYIKQANFKKKKKSEITMKKAQVEKGIYDQGAISKWKLIPRTLGAATGGVLGYLQGGVAGIKKGALAGWKETADLCTQTGLC